MKRTAFLSLMFSVFLVLIALFRVQGHIRYPSPQASQVTLSTRQTAEKLMDLMDYRMAIQYYQHLIDKYPDQKGLRARLSFAFIQLGEHERAREILVEESRLFPGDRDALVLLSYALYLDNDCKEAKNAVLRYRELVLDDFRKSGLDKVSDPTKKKELREGIIRSWQKTNPNIGLPDYILGLCLKQADYYEEAKAAFLRASEMGYDLVACEVQLIDIEVEARNWSDALVRIRDAFNSTGERPEFAFLEGYVHYNLGNAEEALRSFERTCDLRPYMSEALKNLAKLYFIRGENEKAAGLLNRVKVLAPGDMDALSHLEESLKRTPAAQDLRAYDLTTMFIEAMRPIYQYTFRNEMPFILREVNSRFFSFLRSGRIEEAVSYLEQFIRLYDGDASLNFNLANLLSEKKRYQDCLHFASKVVELDRDHKRAQDLIGDVYFAIGDYRHSLQAYQEVIRVAPDDAMAHYNLGCAHKALGEIRQAETHWRKAVQLDKSTPSREGQSEKPEVGLHYSITVRERTPAFYAHLALGKLYTQNGLPLLAHEEFGKAAKLVPSEPETYYEMGMLYMGLREKERAITYFEKYLHLGGEKRAEVLGYLRALRMP